MTNIKKISKFKLNNNNYIPGLGLGVFRIEDETEVKETVKNAILNGYRVIDTAAIYKNEVGVGLGIKEGIKEANIKREDLFIISKLWNDDIRNDNIKHAYNESLKRLQLEYLDLYLIHWPVGEKIISTWKIMEDLYINKKIKNIGVSNFQISHLDLIKENCDIIPCVNQVEYHPLLTQTKLKKYCQKNKVLIQAWSPLMNGEILKNQEILNLAQKYNKTPAQIILRWDIETDVMPIVKSQNIQRMKDNINIFDFELTKDDIIKISNLNQDKRIGPDPDNFDF